MADFVLPRMLHVVAVVLWIGGVGFVTTVLLPSIAQLKSAEERATFFEAIEGRFAWQARVTTVIAGASGFYLLHRMNAWHFFLEPARFYLHGMVGIWLVFTVILFGLEPLYLHAAFARRSASDPEGTFRLIFRLHVVLLSLSLAVTAAAVAGAHGWLWQPIAS